MKSLQTSPKQLPLLWIKFISKIQEKQVLGEQRLKSHCPNLFKPTLAFQLANDNFRDEEKTQTPQ